MLKKMGNQNATPITGEEKAANEAPGNPSIEENQTVNDDLEVADQEEDQILDHMNEKDEDDEGREVNCIELISDEIQESEIQASAIIDGDVEDQEAKNTILNAHARFSHESNDNVLERIKEDNSLDVSEESNVALYTSIDETTNQVTEQENLSIMIETMSEVQEEKVINPVLIISDPDEHEIASQTESNEEEIIEQIEVVKDVMNTTGLEVERYDHDHDTNIQDSSHGSDDDEQEKFYEFVQIPEETENNARSSDHEADFKDLEMVDTQDHDINIDENLEEEKDVSDLKDLEVVNLESSGTETVIEDKKTQSQINKSASFNFEFKNLITITEESDQTPLLYNNNNNKINNNNMVQMRSLSTPSTARFDTSTLSDESIDQEKTINMVDMDYDHKPMNPLDGTQLEKSQKIEEQGENNGIQKELGNGNGIDVSTKERSRERKRNKSSRNSGSYLFSSCICCSGVQEQNDP